MPITKIRLNGIEYDIASQNTEELQNKVDSLQNNLDFLLNRNYPEEILDNWSSIKNNINNNLYKVGDYKFFTIDGRLMTARIAGIDTYYDIINKHHIDWISDDLCMVDWSNDYEGCPWSIDLPNEFNYSDSEIKRFLNSLVIKLSNTLYPYISDKIVRSSQNTYSLGKIWIPSVVEIFNDYTSNKIGVANSFIGRTYELFDKYEDCRKKANSSKIISEWWTCDIIDGYVNSAYVDKNGDIQVQEKNDKKRFPICFRIQED